MVFANFDAIFPKIAQLETRSVTVSEDRHVPIGEYGFLPSFCMDKKCDCRRTLINVMQVDPAYDTFHAATISYGWENMGFYREWSRHLDDEILKEFKGPALDPSQKQSPYADFFLEFFKSELLTDKEYASRIKQHYAYIKMKQMSKLPKDLNKLIDHFGACPCGSEKPFRTCCGKRKSRLSRRK